MTAREFEKLADLHRLQGDTREACRLVLIEKISGYAAAKKTGVAESTISRALKRIGRDTCRSCGQVIKIA